jgi:hypothetical protein
LLSTWLVPIVSPLLTGPPSTPGDVTISSDPRCEQKFKKNYIRYSTRHNGIKCSLTRANVFSRPLHSCRVLMKHDSRH